MKVMYTAGFAAASVLALATVSQAALIASDSFHTTADGAGESYVSGAITHSTNPTSGVVGFSKAWTTMNVDPTSNVMVTTTSLSHNLINGATFPGQGISKVDGALRAMYREIDDVPASPTYYFSM